MIVDDNHFAYLKLQRGALDHLAGDRAAWRVAYQDSLTADLETMLPHLPEHCGNVLDVGSGLGGIDVLIDRQYGGDVYVSLMDGIDDPPELKFHNCTYNDMKVARDFLTRNGVVRCGYYSTPPRGAVEFDLIVSLQSWCFHYGPSAYLSFVRQCCHPETVLILDVRTDKPHWREELVDAFGAEVAVALSRPKFERLVFHAK